VTITTASTVLIQLASIASTGSDDGSCHSEGFGAIFGPRPFAPDTTFAGEAMKHSHSDSSHTRENSHVTIKVPPTCGELPNRLMTAFEVAEFIGCHEETIRRAYLRGLLMSQRFGVRGRRFHPADVLDWIKRGAPTRVS
jgi:excisionase family DNA binding protein